MAEGPTEACPHQGWAIHTVRLWSWTLRHIDEVIHLGNMHTPTHLVLRIRALWMP